MARAMFRISDIYAGIDCYGRGSLGDGGFGVGTVRSLLHYIVDTTRTRDV